MGDSATKLYINEVLISPAKVAVVARGHSTLFVFWFGCVILGFSASMT